MDEGTATDRGDVRRRRALVGLLLVLLAAALAGVGCGDSKEDAAREAAAARRRAAAAEAAAAAHARAMTVGRRVFAKHCQACHTLAGKKYDGPVIEFVAPNLDEVRPKRKYVRFRVQYGGSAMASFGGEMTTPEFRAVVTYVTEASGRNVDDVDPPADQLSAGREVFAANCAACHGIAGRELGGGGIYPGTDFNLVKPSAPYVKQMLRSGILPDEPMMPSFRGKLDETEIDAVAAYVSSVAAEGPEAPRSPFLEE